MQSETFTHKTLEVAGSLSNPYVAATFLIWGLLITGLTLVYLWFVFRPAGKNRLGKMGMVIATVLLALSFLATPIAHQSIVTALYAARDPSVLSVGIWGGPPSFLSWLAGSLLAACVFLLYRRRP